MIFKNAIKCMANVVQLLKLCVFKKTHLYLQFENTDFYVFKSQCLKTQSQTIYFL
jgi:hypothetical protein